MQMLASYEPALLNACIAIDATSKRLYPAESSVRVRYVDCLRSYYWLIEPMIGAGLNLADTRFENIKLKNNAAPDLAQIIYEVFRCNHAHGDEVPMTFSVTKSEGGFGAEWHLMNNELHMPDRVVWALLALAVFSRVISMRPPPI